MEPLRYQSGVMRCEQTRFGFKIIKFCQGSVAFDSFYAFVALEPQNLNYFNNRYKHGTFSDFSVFGEEVLRGWGLIPPKDIVEHLQQKHRIKFGINPNDLLDLSRSQIQTENRPTDPPPPFGEHLSNSYPEKPIEALGS